MIERILIQLGKYAIDFAVTQAVTLIQNERDKTSTEPTGPLPFKELERIMEIERNAGHEKKST